MTVMAIMLISLSGCLSGGNSESDLEAEGEAPAELKAYTPINRQGGLDVVYPSANPPRDASPVCQLTAAASNYRVLNLSAVISWTPESDRTEKLRLELRTTGADNNQFIEGPSPLELAAAPFNVTAGQKFGLVVSIVGEESTDPILLEPQAADFAVHFTAEREVDEAGGDLGMWTDDCS